MTKSIILFQIMAENDQEILFYDLMDHLGVP